MALVHTFIAPGGSPTRTLPETTGEETSRQRVGSFRDRASMRGGFQSASGVISATEYAAYPTVYVEGATWKVQDNTNNEYVFIGALKAPVTKDGAVELTADGLAILADREVERILFASQSMEGWSPGDVDPFNFTTGINRGILFEVKANSLVFEINRFVSFRKNASNNPSEWKSAPVVFWAPKVDLKWIKFDIERHGPSPSDYRLELVGTATGPAGSLSVINTWSLAAGGPASVDYQIVGSYDLIGLRVVRESAIKRAPHNRFRLKNVQVGAIATASPYTLNDAFTELFTRMGMSTSVVASSTTDILPYDAARASLASVADDLAVLGAWYWRLWGTTAGATVGEAGPLGEKSYTVSLTHTPLEPIATRRYNVVQYDYEYGGGYTSQDVVRASPDPWPTQDVIFALQLDEPPVKALAERFAQLIANMLSQQWHGGSASLHKVMDGAVEKSATVVRPGDKLVLANNGNIGVLVDEVRHSEDGTLVSADFADSGGLVEQWIAKRQQRLNAGLSGNAATLDLLDSPGPKAPTSVTVLFKSKKRREGHRDYDLFLSCPTVIEDTDDEGTYCEKYVFRARPRDSTTHVPITDNDGGGWTHRRVQAPKDLEADETPRAKFEDIPPPGKWEWECQAKAIDALGQASDWCTATIEPPATLAPPNPTSASIDVDRRRVQVTHSIPNDPDDPTERHQDFHHAIIEVNDADVWTSPLRQDRKVKQETITFRLPKIGAGTYYARITYVDAHGNKSTPLVVSGSKSVPPLPVIGSVTWDAGGGPQSRFRCRVPVSVNDAGNNDYIRKIRVRFVHKTTAVTPTAADRKSVVTVRPYDDDPDEALFKNIPQNHYCYVSAMSIDDDEKNSGWSTWVALNRPIDAGLSDVPPTPTGLTVVVTAPRRIVGDWDDPDEDATIFDKAVRWRVVTRKGAATVEDKKTRDTRYAYRVPKADVGASHSMQVYAINEFGGVSTPTSQVPATPTDDSGLLPDPPAAPANLSGAHCSFDTQGTRHSRFRLVVNDYPKSLSGGTAAHYTFRMVHADAGTGSPPASARRHYTRVSGDAGGAGQEDEDQAVFKNIPKNHRVWVQHRAVNAGGASTWTSWYEVGLPTGSDVSQSAVGTITKDTSIPHRITWTWPDPNDDLTVRWKVQIKKAGTTLKKTDYVRHPRYTYRIPRADRGTYHTIEVTPITDLGTEGTTSSPDSATELAYDVIGENMAPNPSFESGNLLGWTSSYWTVAADNPHEGANSARVVGDVTTYKSMQFPSPSGGYDWFDVVPGEVYYFEAWYKGISADGSVKLQAALYDDPQGSNPTYPNFATGATSDGSWRKLAGTITIPTGKVKMGLYIESTSHTTGTWYVDDVVAKRATHDALLTGVPDNPSTAPTVTFDTNGTRQSRYRALVEPTAVSGAKWYAVQLCHSSTSGASPPAGTKRHWQRIDAGVTGDDLVAVYKNIPKDHYVWSRYRASNAAGHSASWSGWTSAGRPMDSSGNGRTMAAVGTVSRFHPKPRRFVWRWAYPDDDITTYWRVKVLANGVVVEGDDTNPVYVRQPHYAYTVADVDKGKTFKLNVQPFSDVAADTVGTAVDSADLAEGAQPVVTYPSIGTDGSAPTATVNAIVVPGPLLFNVKWPAASNPDPVFYKVYIHTATMGSNPSASYLVGTTNALSFVITKLATAANLVPGTNYYINVRVCDADGDATTAGTEVGPVTVDSSAGDGVAPNSPSPTPTLRGGPNYIWASWNGYVPGTTDPVTFEVYLDTVTPCATTSDHKVGEVTGTEFVATTGPSAHPGNLAYAQNYYMRLIARDVDGQATAGTTSAVQQLVQVATTDLADDAVSLAKFAATVRPIDIVASLPTITGEYPVGSYVFRTSDNTLWQNVGGSWQRAVSASNLSGQIDGQTQIATDSIYAGQIAAGAISASEIAAGAVTVKKLAVTSFDNLLGSDAGFEDNAGADTSWTLDTASYVTTAPRTGTYHLNVTKAGACKQYSVKVPVVFGESFYAEAYVRRNGGTDGGTQTRVGLQFLQANGSTQVSYVTRAAETLATTSTYIKKWVLSDVPSTAAFVRVVLEVVAEDSTSTYWDDAHLKQRLLGELIVDGVIDANHLKADLVLATSIIAGTAGGDRVVLSGSGVEAYTGASTRTVYIRSNPAGGPHEFTGHLTATELDATGRFQMPVVSRPSSPAQGELYFDTNAGTCFLYNGRFWEPMDPVALARVAYNMDDFLIPIESDPVGIAKYTGASSGSWSAADSLPYHPGIWTGATGTSSSNALAGMKTQNNAVKFTYGLWRCGWLIHTPGNLSDGTNTYEIAAGFWSGNDPTSATQGAFLRYRGSTTSGNWQGYCNAGAGASTVDTAVVVDTNTWYLLEVEVNAAGTAVKFYVNGVYKGQVTASIPGAAAAMECRSAISKVAGTTTRSADWDFYYMLHETSGARY